MNNIGFSCTRFCGNLLAILGLAIGIVVPAGRMHAQSVASVADPAFGFLAINTFSTNFVDGKLLVDFGFTLNNPPQYGGYAALLLIDSRGIVAGSLETHLYSITNNTFNYGLQPSNIDWSGTVFSSNNNLYFNGQAVFSGALSGSYVLTGIAAANYFDYSGQYVYRYKSKSFSVNFGTGAVESYPAVSPTNKGELPVPQYTRKSNLISDPVDVTSGAFYVNQVDLRVDGPLPIVIRRINSGRNTTINEVGYGWVSGYTSYFVLSDDLSTIVAVSTDGTSLLFRKQSGLSVWLPGIVDNPEYSNDLPTSQNLLNSKIIQTVGSNGEVQYEWQFADGSKSNYSVRQFPITDTTVDRERPYLMSMSDNRGNKLNFTYGTSESGFDYGCINKITSSSGASVLLTYRWDGLLQQVNARDGRVVRYNYTGVNLTEVIMPDAARFGFQYDSANLITQETKPDGRILKNVYDEAGRVIEQRATVGVGGELIVNATFDYGTPGQTTVRDAYGNPTVYQYSGALVTKITDPLGRAITQTWYDFTDATAGAYPGRLHTVSDHRGLVTSYAYDSSGNMVETQITGDLEGKGDGSAQTVTSTATYNVLNLPLTFTDASGITTSIAYTDTNYPYLPTQIETSKAGTVLRTDKLEYIAQTDPSSPSVFSRGLLRRKIVALGSSDEAVTEYEYSPFGFMTKQTEFTGTTDPNVVSSLTYTTRGELLCATDGDGRKINYTYDNMSRPLTKVVIDENGITLGTSATTYTANGEVASVSGPNLSPLNHAENTYDGAGRLIQTAVSQAQAKPDGTGVEARDSAISYYTHDYFGNLTSVIDPNGNPTEFTYDAIGQTLTKSTAGLRTESFQYEPGGNVSHYTNPLGGVTNKFYTSTGKLRRQENPDGSVLEWRYYEDGRLQKEILRNGSYWETVYDDIAHTVTRTLRKSDATALATETSFFDLRGNVIRHTDVEGYETTKTYDGLNRIKSSVGPSTVAGSVQQISTWIYGASNKTLTVRNGLGEKTVTTSDALGRPLLAQVLDVNGNAIRVTRYEYADDHNSVTIFEGQSDLVFSKTIYSDHAGRPVLTVFGDGKYESKTYDSNGNLITTTDAFGIASNYGYNALNQRIWTGLPDGMVTDFTYDPAGNLLTRSMAGGVLTLTQVFDQAGRKISEQLTGGGETARHYAYAYYAAGTHSVGLLQSTTGPRTTSVVSYDEFMRPQTVTTTGPLAVVNGDTTYGYDRRGLVTTINQASVGNAAGPPTQIARSYDGQGQLRTETVSMAGQVTSSITQTWDAAGRRVSLNESTSTRPAPLFAYQHRADGLTTQVSANGQNYTFAYADTGLLTARSNPFRTLTVDGRNARGAVNYQHVSTEDALPFFEAMDWRDNGTLGSYNAYRSSGWNESRSYDYNDGRNYLVREGFDQAPGRSDYLNYTFDNDNAGLGIRTDAWVDSGAPQGWEASATAINGVARVTADQTNADGRLVPAGGQALGADHVDIFVDGLSKGRAEHPGWLDPVGAWETSLNLNAGAHALTAKAVHPSGQFTATANSSFQVNVPSVTITSGYDDEGHVTGRTWSDGRTQTLTWDAFNRLIKVAQRDSADNGYDWSAVYDGLGRRLKTTQQPITANVASGSPTVTTSIFDPQVEFLEIGVVVNGAKAWKVYGPDLNGVYGGLNGTGGLEATILDADGTAKGVLNDSFGNGVATVSGGVVTWTSTRVGGYGPLPGSAAETLTDITRVAEATAWRGRRIDPTGFYNLGARYYEPTTGRFLSPDPLGHGSDMSLYAFANGDPVNQFDSDGRYGKSTNKDIYLGDNMWASSSDPIYSNWPNGKNDPLADSSIWKGSGSAAMKGAEDYIVGLATGFNDSILGAFDAVLHPINTVDNLADGLGTLAGQIVYDPYGLASDMRNGIVDTITDPGRLGNAVGSAVGTTALAYITGGLSSEGNSASVADRIAAGHAYDKHVIMEGQYGDISVTEFADHIQAVIDNPTVSRHLSKGRTAYLDEASGTVVIVNPAASDLGTAFVPTQTTPLNYFNNLH